MAVYTGAAPPNAVVAAGGLAVSVVLGLHGLFVLVENVIG
jgi:hypothetical protein